MGKFQITGTGLRAADLPQILQSKLELAPAARAAMQASHQHIQKKIQSGEVIYGVNTGFGAFSNVRISDAQIEELQVNLIRSHSAGVGPSFSREEIKTIMLLRANTLARGHSGIRAEVVDHILNFLNHDITPVIPCQGSVGASGDLAPLSHLALGLIGEGHVLLATGEKSPAAKVLKEKGIAPLKLQAKEGLALINGCQVMTAVGLLALNRLRHAVQMADLAGAMTVEGLLGSRKAFDPRISEVRPHAGEIETARSLREILGAESEISKSHVNCAKVQDAYSLRCMPAVHGAVRNALEYALHILETEANSSTDNPLVFEDHILSCGNFHGMPVALALDHLTASCTILASICEQRIAKLMNPTFSELPAFLAPNGGLNSGLMIVHVAAASLASECKSLSFPASVDSIPTSTDKEDHVSMGTIAARKFRQVLSNLEQVVSMELLAASQALEMRRPMRSSPAIEKCFSQIRAQVPFAEKDRVFAEDVEKIHAHFFGGPR